MTKSKYADIDVGTLIRVQSDTAVAALKMKVPVYAVRLVWPEFEQPRAGVYDVVKLCGDNTLQMPSDWVRGDYCTVTSDHKDALLSAAALNGTL